ncbi:serine/threonine-protein kinase [Nonomuraea sp. LPB2021202275-12-8]|uniref:serine/threonine-protein kinase n=1 Tax=Nonomuraea sp. LPB2021202275-12-8 TaxID=3120159 RepID=UPI00300C86A7
MAVARQEGWLLSGRYRLRARLGRGGMGTVWRAYDELLDREVAVKEVILSGPRREEQIARTMREARIAASLSHPNIAAVYDVVLADERPWIVMQFVPSSSLATVIIQRGSLPVPTVTRIGLEVLAALRAAHAANVLHRDVKPANILITGEGRAILTDFGLATTLDQDSGNTLAGIVMGTPAYIAPERARGGPSTACADLWSLGATLYAAVEGRVPFAHSSELATLSAVVTTDPAPFDRAGELAPVISGLLEKDPRARTGAARAQEQLREVAARYEREPGTAAPRPRPGIRARWSRARRTVASHRREMAATAALLICVAATTSWDAGPAATGAQTASRTTSDAGAEISSESAEPTGVLYVQPTSDGRARAARDRRSQVRDRQRSTATPSGKTKKTKAKNIPRGKAKGYGKN